MDELREPGAGSREPEYQRQEPESGKLEPGNEVSREPKAESRKPKAESTSEYSATPSPHWGEGWSEGPGRGEQPETERRTPNAERRKPDAILPITTSEARSSYYGIPPIKKPHWKWEIVLYFFFGGIASGAYTIATIAEVVGGRRYQHLVRAGRYIALPLLAVSPVLLIKDLGKPSRFYNMLRIFKIKSPMSMGTWGLVFFSSFAALSAAGELAAQGFMRGSLPARLALLLPRRLIGRVGSFFAVFVGGYTGVLLAATTVPLWSKNRSFLGPTFISSALSTGAAALSATLVAGGHDDEATMAPLETVEAIALTSELTMLAVQGLNSGSLAYPLIRGKYSTLFLPGLLFGMMIPLLAQIVGLLRGKRSRLGRLLTDILVLLGGLLLRYTIIYAGKETADDPEAYFKQNS